MKRSGIEGVEHLTGTLTTICLCGSMKDSVHKYCGGGGDGDG